MTEPSHFETWSEGRVTVIRTRAQNLYWLRGFEDYWPDARSQQFSDELTGLVDAASGPFVLDLSRVPGLGRDGIALIMRLRKRVINRGKILAVCVSPAVMEVFEISGLNRSIPCATQPETAAEVFETEENGDKAKDRPDDLTDCRRWRTNQPRRPAL